jgi:uncharacterized protein (TIGR02466 family)
MSLFRLSYLRFRVRISINGFASFKVTLYLYLIMKNFMNDYLFPSFLTSCEVENLNSFAVLSDCNLVHSECAGVKKSNVNGWHSELFHGSNTEYQTLNKLSHEALLFANQVLALHNTQQKISKMTWWVNINPENSYNVIHSHPKADLSVVYYVQVAKDSGELVIMRNDGAMHTDLFAKQPNGMRFALKPEVGRFYAFPAHLLHQVLNNVSGQDRISIAFNMTI